MQIVKKNRNIIANTLIVVMTVLLPSIAMAAELDLSAATGELSGVKTAILGIIGTLVVIFGIVLAWRTFRSSAR